MSQYHSHTMTKTQFLAAKEACKGILGHQFEDVTNTSPKRRGQSFGWPLILRCPVCTTERSEGRTYDGRLIPGTREYDWPEGWKDEEYEDLKRADWARMYLEHTQGKKRRRPAEKLQRGRKAS